MVSLNKICIFEHYREFQSRKTLIIEIIFATKKISVNLFRAAPYMLMFILSKDALFHSLSIPYIFHKNSLPIPYKFLTIFYNFLPIFWKFSLKISRRKWNEKKFEWTKDKINALQMRKEEPSRGLHNKTFCARNY